MGFRLEDLLSTVKKLRAPGGCPWDRAQTHQSLRPYMIEEAYEALEVIDQVESDQDSLASPDLRSALIEELGDVLMQVLIHSEIAGEHGHFQFLDVAKGLNDKLIRRHPHVFGEETARNSDEALVNWEKKKAEEKALKKTNASLLDGLPKGLPALQRAVRMTEKLSKTGFRWKGASEALLKLEEEVRELREAIEKGDEKHQEEELGDALFAAATLSHHLGLQPEDALRSALRKFETRFSELEGKLKRAGKKLEEVSTEELLKLWEAKNR